MQKRMLVIASMVIVLASAGTAHADLVAGWDFSQYATAGRLTIDGSTYIDTLDANYSSFDATLGAGSDSAQYGTMFIDGSNGSTDVDPNPGSDVLPMPRAVRKGNTASYTGAIQGNVGGFDLFGVLASEGQANTEFLALQARNAATVVFQADLTPTGDEGKNWDLSFGGETLEGAGSVTVSIDTDCDGAAEGAAPAIALDTTSGATRQLVSFPDGQSQTACFQFAMDAGTVIDNVAIAATPVPEPVVVLGLVAGAGMLALMRRARA